MWVTHSAWTCGNHYPVWFTPQCLVPIPAFLAKMHYLLWPSRFAFCFSFSFIVLMSSSPFWFSANSLVLGEYLVLILSCSTVCHEGRLVVRLGRLWGRACQPVITSWRLLAIICLHYFCLININHGSCLIYYVILNGLALSSHRMHYFSLDMVKFQTWINNI